MQSIFGEKNLYRLRGIVLAVILISGALTIAIPSALPDAYAAPPGKPLKVENLQVVVSSSQNRLIWTEPGDNGSPIVGYRIERQSPNSGGYVTLAVTGTIASPNTATLFLDNFGVTPSTTYNYKVSAINSVGEGPSDEQRNVTTLPGPAVTLSTTATDPTNVSPIPVTATFSEDVTGFTIDDIIVTNGSVDNFAGSGAIYTFDVTPLSDGLVTVDVPANVAIDILGSLNTAATQLSITYDGTAPSVVLSTTASDPTNVSPIPVTATFSEDVTGFTIDDITVTNGIPSNLAGGPSVYTFDVTPSSNGLVSVDVDADVAEDSAANGNTAAATLTRVSDAFILTATTLDRTIINLDWIDAPTSECTELIGYDIYRMGPDDEGFVYLASVGADTTEYSDTDLDGNTTYTYKVIAIYSGEECPPVETNEASATTEPFLNHGGLSFDVTAPSVQGISFSSAQGGTSTEGFGGRLASYSNDIPTQTMNTGIEQRFQVSIYDNNGIAAIKRVVLNMHFDYMETQKADTYFMYIEGEGLTVSDPLGIFGDVKVHRTYNETNMILTFVFTPQKPLSITDIVINAEDEYRNNMNSIIFAAFEIQGEPLTSVEETALESVIPYYKNPDWNQFVIDSDGNMITYDAFGNLDIKQGLVIDEFVQYGGYIGKSERHDNGYYDKLSVEETKAQKIIDSRNPHKIFDEPLKVFKVDKVFKYPSNVGKADRENVKSMNDLKQKEHSKAMNLAKKLS